MSTSRILHTYLGRYTQCFHNYIFTDTSDSLQNIPYLKLNVVSDNIEVPIYYTSLLYKYMEEVDIYCGIRYDNFSFPCKTSTTLIRRAIQNPPAGKYYKIVNNENVYYTAPGHIMNEEFKTLFYITYKGKKVESNIVINSVNVYIDPIVFTDTSKLLHKSIIKYFIPYYSTLEYNITDTPYNTPTNIIVNIQGSPNISIQNLDHLVIKSHDLLLPDSINNEDINNVLNNCIEDVIYNCR